MQLSKLFEGTLLSNKQEQFVKKIMTDLNPFQLCKNKSLQIFAVIWLYFSTCSVTYANSTMPPDEWTGIPIYSPNGEKVVVNWPIPSMIDSDGKVIIHSTQRNKPSVFRNREFQKSIILNSKTYELLITLPQPLLHLVWSPNSELILGIPFNSHNLIVYDAFTGKGLSEIPQNSSNCRNVISWSPNSKEFTTIGPTEIMVWNAFSGKKILELPGKSLIVSWSPLGNKIAGCIENKKETIVRLWNSKNGEVESDFTSPKRISDIGWSHKGEFFAYTDGSFLHIINSNTLKKIVSLELQLQSSIGKLKWSPVSNEIAYGVSDEMIQIYDMNTLKVLSKIPTEKTGRYFMIWSPNGRYLLVYDYSDQIAICNASTGKYIGAKKLQIGGIKNWTPDGQNIIASCIETKSVKLIPIDFNSKQSSIKGGTRGNPWHNQKVLRNLDDCFEALSKILAPSEIKNLKNTKEQDVSGFEWPGLGVALRNTWGLNENTPLVNYFHRNGVTHPKEMTAIIIKSYWEKLNKQPISFSTEK